VSGLCVGAGIWAASQQNTPVQTARHGRLFASAQPQPELLLPAASSRPRPLKLCQVPLFMSATSPRPALPLLHHSLPTSPLIVLSAAPATHTSARPCRTGLPTSASAPSAVLHNMRLLHGLAVAATACSLADALTLVERSVSNAKLLSLTWPLTRPLQNPKVVSLDTVRRSLSVSPAKHDRNRLRKRAGTLLEILDNDQETLYFANVSLGTPAQDLRLDIDTGSSDIWANSANSQLCVEYQAECAISGFYNANNSKTYTYVNSEFEIKYADGSEAIGDYATDTLSIGGTAIENVQFGIGYESSSPQGILGIGYETNEASISTIDKTYANFPAVLVSSGVINTMAYSLWLNDIDANQGSILFGGVDSDKFTGTLSTLPIIPEQGQYREFVIGLTGLTVANESILTSSDSAVAVLLDSGSSLSYLPSSLANATFQIFSAAYDESAGAAVVSCSWMNSHDTVDFDFSGKTITVSMSELVLIDGYRHNEAVCILGISDAGDTTAVLGDTFLRSAYVVYDLSNNEISLAQTDFNATSSNVQEITSGASGIPNAVGVPSAVTSLSYSSGGARNGGQPTVTSIRSGSFGVPSAVPAGLPYGKLAAVMLAGFGAGVALIL